MDARVRITWKGYGLRRSDTGSQEGLVAVADQGGAQAIALSIQINDDTVDLRQVSHKIGPRDLDLSFVQTPL